MCVQGASFILVFLVIIQNSYALKCYMCEQHNNDTEELCDKNYGKVMTCDSKVMKEAMSHIPEHDQSGFRERIQNDPMTNVKPVCANIALSISNDTHRKTAYVKTCIPEDEKEHICNSFKFYHPKNPMAQGQNICVECFFCNKDGCNSAVLTKPTSLLIMFWMIILKQISY